MLKARGDDDGGHSRHPHGRSGHHGQGRHHCRPHEGHHDGLLEILLEHGGQEFCSQFLHLPTTATATSTQTVSDIEATVTLTTTATSDPGTTTVSETTTSTSVTTSITSTTVTVNARRSVPTWLPFPESEISSVCSQLVTPTTTTVGATTTSTDVLTTTETATTTTTLPLQTETDTTTTTTTTTAQATTTITVDRCTTCPLTDTQGGTLINVQELGGAEVICTYVDPVSSIQTNCVYDEIGGSLVVPFPSCPTSIC